MQTSEQTAQREAGSSPATLLDAEVEWNKKYSCAYGTNKEVALCGKKRTTKLYDRPLKPVCPICQSLINYGSI